MKKLYIILLVAAALWSSVPAICCTSVIISSRATADGRPLMFKNRDTGELNNRVEYFVGPKFTFIGLVNSPSEGGEVWTGTNSAGFSIMNTASYNIKDDDVPDSKMDREGEVMYKALGICENLSDFEKLLDTLPRPMGVEANFGVIDAHGGAAYYEVNNHSWVKFDVNEEPSGYRVVTNFSTSGRYEEYEGYERYLTASEIMAEIRADESAWSQISHKDIVNRFSRSYRHKLLGMDYERDWDYLTANTSFSGVAVDQDFIPRKSTSASVIVEGVAPGENPLYTVMWTLIGHPSTSVSIPLIVADGDRLPSYIKRTEESQNCKICDTAMSIKANHIFTFDISNGSHYFRIDNILKGTDGRSSLQQCCRNVESKINSSFDELHAKWITGSVTDQQFYASYEKLVAKYFDMYLDGFNTYL